MRELTTEHFGMDVAEFLPTISWGASTRLTKGCVLVLSAALLSTSWADAQTQHAQPGFRAGVTRIEVTALVVDSQGRPVPDLRPDEVQVFEAGQQQQIRTFTHVRLDSDAREAGTNSAPGLTASNGTRKSSRLVGLLIDDLHIDAKRAERARSLARQVVDQLGPSDLLFVGLTSDPTQSTGVFTTSRRRASDLIERFSGTRLPPPAVVLLDTPALPTQIPRMLGDDMGLSAGMQQHGSRLAQAFVALEGLAEGLSTTAGRRKTLFLLTEGPAAPIREDQGAGPAAAEALQQALASAARADLAVYPLNPAGLDTPTDGMIEGFTRAVDASGREVAHEDLSYAIRDFVAGRTLLRDLAALTGGRALTDRNDVSSAIAETLREAADYYVISYEPERETRAALVPLELRVSRPGVRVRTRRGRAVGPLAGAAAAPGVTDATAHLLRSLGVNGGLPMTLRAFRLANPDGSASYAIVAKVAGEPLVRAVTGDRLLIEQALVTIDANGTFGSATKRSVELRLPQEQVMLLQSTGLRTVWVVDLPTGFQQVRVATMHPTTGLGGMVALDLHVGAESPSEVSALVAEMSRALPTAFVDPRLEPLLPHKSGPLRNTTAASAAASSAGTWAAALQAYQRREYAAVTGLAGAIAGADLDDEVARDTARWRDNPDKELAALRLRGSAAMALELALVHVRRSDAEKAARYLRLAEDARDTLRMRVGPNAFTAHWDLTRLHLLLLASDFAGVNRAGSRVPSDELSPESLAEWYSARGLAREAQSRQALWDRPTNTQVLALNPTSFDRELWIANERAAAIAEYRRAIAASPAHREAQLRLGRMLFENGQAAEALPHLAVAATRDCSSVLCGLGWLFLGDWHAKHGTAADARDAYLLASRVLDVRQSALVALLRLRLVESPGAAAELVRQFDANSMLARQQEPDAWSRYLASSPMGLPSLISALREGASQ